LIFISSKLLKKEKDMVLYIKEDLNMGVKIAAYTIDKDLLDKFNRITEIEYVNKSSLIACFIESYLKNYKSNGY